MCGFLLTNSAGVDSAFARAFHQMDHRGPDSASIVEDFGGYTVGCCRLAIIGDPQRASQPMIDASGRYLLAFNGEIYNYSELARKYGLELETSSDTELLLRLFLIKGSGCVSELDGMFAFVVVDKALRRLFAARDRLGAKPLFKWQNGESLILSSEVAPILDLIGGAEPDPFAIRQYRAMRGVFNGRTFYRAISSFPAGCHFDGRATTRYWKLEKQFDEAPTREELRSLVDFAIDYRMVADVEVAGFLSGGLDSTITSLASGIRSTWCCGFQEDPDFAVARRIADERGLYHHEVVVSRDTYVETVDRMIRARREPLCVPNEVVLYLAAQDVRRAGIKCTLSGEGADELFAGYDRIFLWANSTRSFDVAGFAQHYCYGNTSDLEVVEDALAPFLYLQDPYLITSAFFQIAHLERLLYRLDMATMLASVEGREPFADFHLVERLFGLPMSYKHAHYGNKTPLKIAYEDVIPAYVLEREKRGFPVPLSEIFNDSRGNKPGYTAWFDHNLNVLGWQA
jgi:asparagine synthase (glutamine-hydrolysing)